MYAQANVAYMGFGEMAQEWVPPGFRRMTCMEMLFLCDVWRKCHMEEARSVLLDIQS